MRAAMLGALMLGLAVAGLGIAQPLPTPAVPSTPTPVERFVTWLKTPPKAAIPRKRVADEKVVELPAAPAPGEVTPPPLPTVTASDGVASKGADDDPFAPPVAANAARPSTAEAGTAAPAATSTPGNRLGWLRPARRSAPSPATAKTGPSFQSPLPPTPAATCHDGIPVAGKTNPRLTTQAPVVPAPEPEVELAPPPAQLPPATPLPPPTPLQTEFPQIMPAPEMSREPTLGFNDEVFVYDSPGAYWTSVEYLMWRTLHAPLGYPMANASLVGVGTGAQYTTGAVPFFDKGNMSYPWYSGARVTAGMWLDSCERTGIEGSGFFVNTPGIHFASVASASVPSLSGPGGPQGPITIYLPFINSVSGAAAAQVIGAQASSVGFINIDSTSNLNGAELNLVRNIYRGPDCYVELLGGYRYVDLKETLNLTADTNATGTTTALTAPNQFLLTDGFTTRNQFNGAQLGGRVTWRRDAFRVSMSGKMALGVTNEQGTISGATTFFSSASPVTVPGGFYAQPSNIGSYTRSQFSAVPQFGLNLGYQAGKHCFFYFGYDMLYWTRVVRPGDMVNPLLNPASIPSNPSYTGAASTSPAPLFLSRDFWAQGVNMGLEVKY